MERNAEAHDSVNGKEAATPEVIVGIGASAGGLGALKSFFAQVPEDSGLAFVVVVHLLPDHESHMADLLQACVKMPVQQVSDTTLLEANQVYVIPPGRNLSTIDTHLRLSELEERRRERAPIDHFFRTLAKTHDGDSVGVILTGTGSDGTLGVKEIKEQNGLAIAQDPNEAEYDGMPQSAIATGMVDLILPVAKIPDAILRYAHTKPRVALREETDDGEDRHWLQRVLAQVRARTGRDFSRYKLSTITRRIQRRMQLAHVETMEDYSALLREAPGEVRELSDDFLITVTSFFRDPEVYSLVQTDVLPKLFEHKQPEDTLRVWSVGCATGEEVYSIAILLVEAADRLDTPPQLQIFASDLHEHSLEKAREGFYPGDIETDVSPERLHRFFVRESGGFRIRKELRELVVFAPHNVLGDPPFSKLDLIACRNLMIYMRRDVQRDVIDLFHYALNPDGYLLLGTSEIIETAELFHTADKQRGLYRKRNVPAPDPRLPVFPLFRKNSEVEQQTSQAEPEPMPYGALHHRIVERHAPPSLLLNPAFRAVHYSEHVGRYLVHPGGEPTASIFKLVRDELRLELRAALQLAKEDGRPAKSQPVQIKLDGLPRCVVLTVVPLTETQQEGFMLVIFEEFDANQTGPENERATPGQGAGESANEPEVRELRTELDLTKQRLQAVVEEYETGQEEMKASNEELQSANEELRSTMEELETSKEELQSINEELETVNQENRHKVEELDRLSSDLQNLMAATDIATLFLDRELRILRFTPRTADLFNIRLADRGRPLSDLTHRLYYGELIDDARGVLEGLVPVEREISDERGNWYLVRVRPYRSGSDRIEGVVVTFVDITGRKRSEEALRQSETQFRALVDASAQTVWTTGPDGNVVEDSASWRKLTGQSFEQRKGLGWLNVVHPDDRAFVREIWQHSVAAGERMEAEFRLYHAPSDEYRWTSVRAVPLQEPDGAIRGWVGMSADVTERKKAEAARVHFRSLFESAPGLYLVLEPAHFEIVAASDAYLRATYSDRESIMGCSVFETFPDDPDDPQADGVAKLRVSLDRVKHEKRADVMAVQRYPIPAPEGNEAHFEERFWSPLNSPVLGPDGELAYIIHRVEDVTPFVRMMREQDREAELHRMLELRAEQMEADIILRAGDIQRANELLKDLNRTLEARVEARTREVRELASSLTMAEQEERRRISRILHDDLQQLLYGIQLKLTLISDQIPADTNGKVATQTREAYDWIDQAIVTTRRLTVELSPPILNNEGLADALVWLQSQMHDLHGLEVELTAEHAFHIGSEDMRVLLFQTVRELLSNVAEHAGTDRCRVALRRLGNELLIEVSDNGRGFDPASIRVAGKESFGLISARERLALFDARLDTWSLPGRGTQHTIRVPMRQADASNVDLESP